MRKSVLKGFHCFVAAVVTIAVFACGADLLRAENPSTKKQPLLPKMPGWKQSGGIQTFNPETLYNYINGAADLYLKYHFQELKAADYAGPKDASVTVEMYRHKTPNDAFGIYSQERLATATILNIGAQGYSDEGYLCFVAGNYYVKITGNKVGADEAEVLTAFGRKAAENLGKTGGLPAVLSAFPEEGKKRNAEKYVAQNFLGYSFLHSGFIADYDRSGKRFQLFIIEGRDAKDCRQMVQSYLQKLKSSKAAEEGEFNLSDPYHGVIDLAWRGRYIWGVMNLEDPPLRSAYMHSLARGIAKIK